MTEQPHLYCILDLGYVLEVEAERVAAAALGRRLRQNAVLRVVRGTPVGLLSLR